MEMKKNYVNDFFCQNKCCLQLFFPAPEFFNFLAICAFESLKSGFI